MQVVGKVRNGGVAAARGRGQGTRHVMTDGLHRRHRIVPRHAHHAHAHVGVGVPVGQVLRLEVKG